MRVKYDDSFVEKKYNKLTIKKIIGKNFRGDIICECLCECSNTIELLCTMVVKGKQKSCGCLLWGKKDTIRDLREYGIWSNLFQRCYNPNNSAYHNYGGRGIRVSKDWEENFRNFYRDMGPRPSKNYSIERKNNDKDYCKENCYWGTRKEQARNTRQNIFLTHKNETLCLQDWSSRLGIHRTTLKSRIRMGWSVERVLTTPTPKMRFLLKNN